MNLLTAISNGIDLTTLDEAELGFSDPEECEFADAIIEAKLEKIRAAAAAAAAAATAATAATAAKITPLDGALMMAARGVPQTPVRPKTKIALLKDWTLNHSTNPEDIRGYAVSFPDCNFASVAKAEIGGTLFFETDTPPSGSLKVWERIKLETGHVMAELRTVKVRSSPGRGHVLFKHTAASIQVGNISQGVVKGNDWSLRGDRAYCITSGSFHPTSGRQYELIENNEVIEIPQWLLDWCVSQTEEKVKSPATINGDRIPRGAHDDSLTRIGGLLRRDGLEEDSIRDALIEVVEKRCDDYGDDYKEMAAKVAKSVCRYPVGKDYTQQLLSNGVPMTGSAPGSVPAAQVASIELTTVRADHVVSKRVEWLWEDRIPFNKLSVLSGNPDEGKSLVSLYMIAQVTNGKSMYLSSLSTPPHEVLIMAAEDEPDDTIRPRLEAAGADLTKVHILQSITMKDGKGKTVSEREAQLDIDIQAVENKLKLNPSIRLVVIDPISSFLGKANMNREQDVRKVLTPLKSLAFRCKVAIVAVMHLNKSADASAIHRIGGAVAFTGVARAVWLFTRDTEDPMKHQMLRVKNNLARSTGGLVYTIPARSLMIEGKNVSVPYVEWVGVTENVASDVLFSGRPGRPNKVSAVKDWLADFLENGCETAADVKKFGLKEGFSWRTIERAKAELHVIVKKEGGSDGFWEWRLPETQAAITVDLDQTEAENNDRWKCAEEVPE